MLSLINNFAHQVENAPQLMGTYPTASAKKKPVIFACIPALNEERTIGGIVLQVQKYVDATFVCDDGSSDLTGDLAEALGVYVIKHPTNMGKGAALKSLFEFVGKFNPDIVVVLDADGQHNPDDIPNLIEPILNGEADMVVGSRFVKGGKADAPLYRRIGLYLLSSHKSKGIRDVQSGFRAFSGKALEVVSKSEANDFGVELEQIALAKNNEIIMKEVPVVIRYKGLYKTSSRHPIVQGVQIIKTMMRLQGNTRSLIILGMFAAFLIILGLVDGLFFSVDYISTKYFNIVLGYIFVISLVLGSLIAISALVFFAISSIKKIFY